ncbi:MAG TPA: NADH-quinone oxidoreductase subunit A [Spirochaetota bacterium]|nr:NADH-quinone oxidoreductase subunit A [Spirochaetota bacterium]
MFFNTFGPVAIHMAFALAFAIIILILTNILGPRKYDPAKSETYECGVQYFNDARGHIHIKFYLVAVLFILFDIEAIFIVPWTVVFFEFKRMGLGFFIFAEMAVFVLILILGYIYILKKGALKWE